MLANDTDGADTGETLTVTAVDPGRATARSTFTARPGVTYTPAANFYGTDSFTYTITDGNGGSDTATVDRHGHQRQRRPGRRSTTRRRWPRTAAANAIDVLANDTDGVDTGETLTVTAVDPGHATASRRPSTPTGVTYTPAADFIGPTASPTRSATATAARDTATVTVTVTNVNDDPVAADDAATVAEDSGGQPIDVLANDTDGAGHRRDADGDRGHPAARTARSTFTRRPGVTLHAGRQLLRHRQLHLHDHRRQRRQRHRDGDGHGHQRQRRPGRRSTTRRRWPRTAAANAIDVLANDSDDADTGETLTVTAVDPGQPTARSTFDADAASPTRRTPNFFGTRQLHLHDQRRQRRQRHRDGRRSR